MKTAVIFGVTGQSGSYLAELLLSKGYRVIGVGRRVSVPTDQRIKHLFPNANFKLVQGDVTDASSVTRILLQADDLSRDGSEYCLSDDTDRLEVYNLSAQSHVGTSFEQPVATTESTYLGALNILECLRGLVKPGGRRIRFYQASSSEMFGGMCSYQIESSGQIVHCQAAKGHHAGTPGGFQNEQTPMVPNSPYAIAKLAAHNLCRVYRDSYGIFGCNGILFNHECVSAETPLLVRKKGVISVKTPDELVSVREKGANSQTTDIVDAEVWDGEQWSSIHCITATRRRPSDLDHEVVSIETRAGVVDVTNHHHMLDHELSSVQAREVYEGKRLAIASSLPTTPSITVLSDCMAEFLGLMTAEGCVMEYEARFTNKDQTLLDRVVDLWNKLFLGTAKHSAGSSGFTGEPVPYVALTGVGQNTYAMLREWLYHYAGWKRVPDLVLNAPPTTQKIFLDAYYSGDGLKAGNGDSVKTNSPLLGLGILWLYSQMGNKCTVYKEQRDDKTYFQLNVLAGGTKGQHLCKSRDEVRQKRSSNRPTEWVFDLETGTRKFMAGVGTVIVHNSERRGELFVTRKITKYIAELKYALEHGEPNPVLKLGNIDAKRDWGHAEDYVRGMWMMLQQEKPDDYVLATGEAHSVRDFLVAAFDAAGIPFDASYLQIDPALCRPCEVPFLKGDATKARTQLGWKPEVSFDELVRRMVYSDVRELEAGKGGV